MDPSKIDSFENQWQKAFKEATETPPPSVWEGIEAVLDDGSKNVVPLNPWWKPATMWYAAASVAAVLMVAGGIWYADFKNGNSNVATGITAPARQESSKEILGSQPETNVAASPEKLVETDRIAKAEGGKSNAESEVQVSRESIRSNTGNSDKTENIARIEAKKSGSESKSVITSERVAIGTENRSTNNSIQAGKEGKAGAALANSSKTQLPATRTPETGLNNEQIARIAQNNIQPITPITSSEAETASLLAGLPYSDLDVHFQKRYVYFRPEAQPEEPVEIKSNKEYWAGVGLMPATFNPDVKIKEAPMAFSGQTVSNKKSVSGTSESGVSYALQTQGGMRLSKHWSVEMGLNYLKGNSAYQGGGYVLSAYTSQSANVLENALADLAPASSYLGSQKNYNLDNSAIYIDVAKKVSNNYQYLQLPFQAGFTLNPDKKLSYSLLGGVMANFFLSNDLESASGEIVTTKASDEIYRSLNWAATTGLRFNYSLSSKWKASLTGSYQKAVSSGFRSNQSLESHPYLYGVSWGVRYSF